MLSIEDYHYCRFYKIVVFFRICEMRDLRTPVNETCVLLSFTCVK